jgi:hypothetical protein
MEIHSTGRCFVMDVCYLCGRFQQYQQTKRERCTVHDINRSTRLINNGTCFEINISKVASLVQWKLNFVDNQLFEARIRGNTKTTDRGPFAIVYFCCRPSVEGSVRLPRDLVTELGSDLIRDTRRVSWSVPEDLVQDLRSGSINTFAYIVTVGLKARIRNRRNSPC